MNVFTPDSAEYAALNSALDDARASAVKGFDYLQFLRKYNAAPAQTIISAEYDSANLSNFRASLRSRGLEFGVDYVAELIHAKPAEGEEVGRAYVVVRRESLATGRLDRLPRFSKSAKTSEAPVVVEVAAAGGVDGGVAEGADVPA